VLAPPGADRRGVVPLLENESMAVGSPPRLEALACQLALGNGRRDCAARLTGA
jgi:hypothetical protein